MLCFPVPNCNFDQQINRAGGTSINFSKKKMASFDVKHLFSPRPNQLQETKVYCEHYSNEVPR